MSKTASIQKHFDIAWAAYRDSFRCAERNPSSPFWPAMIIKQRAHVRRAIRLMRAA